jgi:hypothetical protein
MPSTVSEMLLQRVRKIYELAHDGMALQSLKAIKLSIQSLENNRILGVSVKDMNLYSAILYQAALFANCGDMAAVKQLMWNLYHRIDYNCIDVANVPKTVRICYEDLFKGC